MLECNALHTLKTTIPLSTEITGVQLKNKDTPITLRQALESYNERVEFVKHSSSACVVSSCELLLCFETVELFYLELKPFLKVRKLPENFLVQALFFGLIRSLTDPTLAALVVCGPLQLVTRCLTVLTIKIRFTLQWN